MNIEDLISINGKRLPVRVLLNIMDLEADLKGASYWATYLLYYAYDTKDSELRGEVERRLLALKQPPYEGKETPPPPPSQPIMYNHEILFKLRCAICELMELKDNQGEYLFTYQNQWIAIFWDVVELSIGIYAFQYQDFKSLVEQLNLVDIRVQFVFTSINDCAHTDYKGIHNEWIYTGKSSKGRTAFNKMKQIAEEFQKLLEKHGLKTP